MNQYIPDLTERFSEGFGGEDSTDSYFGGGCNDYEEYEEPTEEEEAQFEREFQKFKDDEEMKKQMID